MIRLTFTQEYKYPDERDGIPLPATLNYYGKTITASAKVDTGAAVCLFKREHAEELGIPVEQGIPALFGGLGGAIEAFGHEVGLQTGEFAFQSTVYFAKYPGLPRNILGRQRWLRNLRFAVIDYDNLLYLSPYDS